MRLIVPSRKVVDADIARLARPRRRGNHFHFLRYREGRLDRHAVAKNLVTNVGKDWAKEFLFDSVTPTTLARMGWIAIGTGASAPSTADVELQSEVARVAVEAYTPGGTGVATLKATFGDGVGEGDIVEAGLFNFDDEADTGDPGNVMYDRATRDAFPKGAGDVLVVAVVLTQA